MTVLSNEELNLLHGLVSGIQNTSTYGYEVAVKGTVIDGIATLVCGLTVIISTIYIGKKLLKWAKEADDKRPTYDKGFPYAMAAVGIIVTVLVLAISASYVIHDPFMQIFAPEYVVVKQILAAAANVAT